MKKNILPLENPYFSAYPTTGNSLAILLSHKEIKPWIFNNFIQLFCTDDNTLDFFDFNIENCPFLFFNTVEQDLALQKYSLIEYIESMIDAGYYLIFFVYTSQINAYDIVDEFHDIMVYGYDNKNELLYIADHFKNGKYSFEKCSYEEMNRAFYSDKSQIKKDKNQREYKIFKFIKYDDSMSNIKVNLKYDYEHRFNIDKLRIKESIKNYLEGKIVVNWNTRYVAISNEEIGHHKFGIDCYDMLLQQIDFAVINNKIAFNSVQAFYVMYSHKIIMQLRIEYLTGIVREEDLSIFIKEFSYIKKISYLILMLYVKNFKITNNINIYHTKLRDYIIRLKEDERDLLNEFIKKL